MLELMRRGRPQERQPLPAEEDAALRRAFGRYGHRVWRAEGTEVVRARQAERGGQWFACDCLGTVPFPPVLVPVAEMHVRRHIEGPWPEHSDACDFFREPEEQRAISASFARQDPGGGLDLVRGFGPGRPHKRGVMRASDGRRRSGLARLLMTLLERGGLTRIDPGSIRPMSAQFAALREAAGAIELEAGVKLSRFFCTYPPALPRLIERITQTPPWWFARTARPHGILVGVAVGVADGIIRPTQGDPFPVTGAISMFGEADGHTATRTALAERAPYIMACLIGRRQPDQPVEVLRAYLHPCMSRSWLLPVDSNYERRTVRQLLSVRRWVFEEEGTEPTIEKPVFDMTVPPAATDGDEACAHEPVVPDFLIRGGTGCSVVVETMGFDLPAYRARKARLHPAMTRLCGGAPVVEHDFCRPADWSQEARDRKFRRDCRAALRGRAAGHGANGDIVRATAG